MADEYAETIGDADDALPALPECAICGSTDYYMVGGYYYCSVCSTQTQESRLFVEEDVFTESAGGHRTSRLIVVDDGAQTTTDTSAAIVQKDDPYGGTSSWEVLNVILKIVSDKLVELTYPKDTPKYVLNLWYSYLKRRKAILVSKVQYQPSNFTLNEPSMNVVTALRKSIPKRKTRKKERKEPEKTGDDDLTAKKRNTRLKNKAFENEYLKNLRSSQEVVPDDRRLYSGLDTVVPMSKEDQEDSKPKTESIIPLYTQAYRKWHAKPSDAAEKNEITGVLCAERFSKASALILVFIALRLQAVKVLLSDILRMHNEGTFALKSVLKELQGRKNVHMFLFSAMPSNLRTYAMQVENLVKYLELGNSIVLSTQIGHFMPKFTDDWRLPREFECFVLSLLKLLPHHSFQARNKVESVFPELRIFALLCSGLKLLFGFDDVTEKYQSDFAKAFNSALQLIMEKNNNEEMRESRAYDWSKLFVLEDWFTFLQARHRLTQQVYFPQASCSSGTFSGDDHSSSTRTPSDDKFARACQAARDFFAASSQMYNFSYGSYGQGFNGRVHYATPVLPFEDIVQCYLRTLTSDNARLVPILLQDFTKARIDYVVHPEKYIPVLEKCGYKVDVISGSAKNCDRDLAQYGDRFIPLFQPFKRFSDEWDSGTDGFSDSFTFILTEFARVVFLGIDEKEVVDQLKSLMTRNDELLSTVSREGRINIVLP